MPTPPDFAAIVAQSVAHAADRARDGLSLADFAELTTDLCRVAIAAADQLAMPGRDKKAWVVDAVGALFDAVADRAVPPLAWPAWMLLRPAARAITLALAGGLIESLLPLVRHAP